LIRIDPTGRSWTLDNCRTNADVYTIAPFTPDNINNWTASGQNLPAPVDSNGTLADHIAFLGSASTPSSTGATGTATITFTDGNTQQIPIVLPDWTLNNNTFTPAGGNTIVATGTYRNLNTGTTENQNTYLYTTTDTRLLDNGQPLPTTGQQIASITLPNNTAIHIFAIAVN